jgi:hypothetical protein
VRDRASRDSGGALLIRGPSFVWGSGFCGAA